MTTAEEAILLTACARMGASIAVDLDSDIVYDMGIQR